MLGYSVVVVKPLLANKCVYDTCAIQNEHNWGPNMNIFMLNLNT